MSSDPRDLDLDEQLRSFAITLEIGAGGPIRPDPRRPRADADVREPDVVDLTPVQPERRRWLLPALAAAAVMVVVVAGLVVLSADDAPSDPPVQTVEPTPEPDATVAPEPTVPPEPEPTVAPEPTVTPPVTTTDVQAVEGPPALAPPESGETQRTVIGDITWTLLESDSSSQPPTVSVEIDGEFFGFEGDGRTWRSSDGITWELLQLPPIEVLDVFEFETETWARTFTDVGLARRDGEAFVPLDIPESQAPDVEGLSRSTSGFGDYGQDPVEFGSALVKPGGTRLAVPWSEIFSTQVFSEWDEVTETIRIYELQANEAQTVALLTAELVEGDPGGVEFRNAETGELVTSVGLIPDIDPDEFFMRLVTDGGLSFNEVLIGDRDGFELVEGPRRFADQTRVAALDGGLIGVVATPRFDDDGLRRQDWTLWSSVDARTWRPLELPTPIGSEMNSVQIVSDGSLALLSISSSEPLTAEEREELEALDEPWPEPWSETWSTVDGTSWVPQEDVGGIGNTEVTAIGWFRSEIFEGGGVSVSPDGLVWQEIPIALDRSFEYEGGRVSVLGRTIFASVHGSERRMWVGHVADG